MNISELIKVIYNAASNNNTMLLSVLWFLLNNLNVEIKERFPIQSHIETIERLLGYKLPETYNPMKPDKNLKL